MEEDREIQVHSYTGGLVVQDNALIHSAQSMSLPERRLLYLALSRIYSEAEYTRGTRIGVTVTAEEWASNFETANPWRDLKDAAEGLYNREVRLTPDANTLRKIRWLDESVYKRNTYSIDRCHVQIVFSGGIVPYLIGLRDEFTVMQLSAAITPSSVYAMRLNELLHQMGRNDKPLSWLHLSIDEFRFIMEVQDKYQKFSDLRKYVIEAAINDLQASSGYKITWEAIRKGRSVKALKFFYDRQLGFGF